MNWILLDGLYHMRNSAYFYKSDQTLQFHYCDWVLLDKGLMELKAVLKINALDTLPNKKILEAINNALKELEDACDP